MARYIRPRQTGASVFFTVALAQRGGALLLSHIDLLRDAVRVTRARRPFRIDAWVVMPDHMHAVWTLPDDDANYSDRWGAIKARFSKHVRLRCRVGFQPTEAAMLRAARSPSKRSKQDAGIWQRRFWEHHIRNQRDFDVHIQYCWTNPVKHGFVPRAVDWPYSSIHRDIRLGRVGADFAGDSPTGRFGERDEARLLSGYNRWR